MLDIFLTTVLVAALIVYIKYLLLFKRGIKPQVKVLKNIKPSVSVVIAARNEEQTLPRLLTVLANQSYPLDKYEVIIANDDSEDNTANIVREFSQKWENIKLLNVKNRLEVPSPKKNALSQAIELASNEIILSTDADCYVGKYWIESMAREFADESVKMVCGFSKTRIANWKKAPLVRKFEHFDFLAMFSAAAGAIGSEKYFSCSGQNISYRKKDFLEVGGFTKIWHLISGDDVNLMQLFRQAKKKIIFNTNPHSFANTQAIESWKQLFNQRSRWASNMKWQIKLNPEFFLYLISTFILTVGVYFYFPLGWWIPLLVIFLRMIFEIQFLKKSFGFFQVEKKLLKFYPIWFFIQPVYMVLISILGAFSIFSWKK